MSAYEDYTAVAADYDRTRIPIGVEIILGCLAAATGGGGGRRRAIVPSRARCRVRDGQLRGRPPPPRRRHRRGGSQPFDARSRSGEARPAAGMSGHPPRGEPRVPPLRGRELRRGDGEPGAPPPSRFPGRGPAAPPSCARRARARPPAGRGGGRQHLLPRADPGGMVVRGAGPGRGGDDVWASPGHRGPDPPPRRSRPRAPRPVRAVRRAHARRRVLRRPRAPRPRRGGAWRLAVVGRFRGGA